MKIKNKIIKLITGITLVTVTILFVLLYWYAYYHQNEPTQNTHINEALFLKPLTFENDIQFNQKNPRNLFATLINNLILWQFCDYYSFTDRIIDCISPVPMDTQVTDLSLFTTNWARKFSIITAALLNTEYTLQQIPAIASGNKCLINIPDKGSVQTFYLAKREDNNWYFTEKNFTSPENIRKYHIFANQISKFQNQEEMFLSSPKGAYTTFVLASREKYDFVFQQAMDVMELNWVNPLIKHKYSRFIAHLLFKVLEFKDVSIVSVARSVPAYDTKYILCTTKNHDSSIFMSKKNINNKGNYKWWFNKKALDNALYIYLNVKGVTQSVNHKNLLWYFLDGLGMNNLNLFYTSIFGIPSILLLSILIGFFIFYCFYFVSKWLIRSFFQLLLFITTKKNIKNLSTCSALLIAVFSYDQIISYPFMYYYKFYLFYAYLRTIAYGILLIWWSCEIINMTCSIFIYFSKKRYKNKFQLDFTVEIIKRLLCILIIVVFSGILFQKLGLDMTSFLAAMGLGGIALAYAGKDTIENLLGSIMIAIEKPFDLGDWIIIENVEGNVEHIGLRSTRIREFKDSYLTVPNVKFITSPVINMEKRMYRRYKTLLSLEHSTPTSLILSLTEGITELIKVTPGMRKEDYFVRVYDFGNTSLNVLVYVFFTAPDWETELRERERFILNIKRLIDKLNIKLAFPEQTIYLTKHKEIDFESNSELNTEQLRVKTTQAKSIARKIVEKFMGNPPKEPLPFKYESK